jgi:hypothetical protein
MTTDTKSASLPAVLKSITGKKEAGILVGLGALAAAGAGIYSKRRELIAWWLNFTKPEFGVRISAGDTLALLGDLQQRAAARKVLEEIPS